MSENADEYPGMVLSLTQLVEVVKVLSETGLNPSTMTGLTIEVAEEDYGFFTGGTATLSGDFVSPSGIVMALTITVAQ